jgi:DNA polymerase-3 subunit beta
VSIETKTEQNPAVFRPVGVDGYIHIVMPMMVR